MTRRPSGLTEGWNAPPSTLVTRASERVHIPRGTQVRRLHKAFLRYHDPDNWPLLLPAPVDAVIDAADLLRSRRDILLLFIGDGNRRAALEQSVKARALDLISDDEDTGDWEPAPPPPVPYRA